MVEMTQEYLDNMTLIADFWIAGADKKIKSFENEGISIEKSKIYLNKYMIKIFVKKEHYPSLDLFNEGWQQRAPHAVITKASGKVEAYELKFKGAQEKQNSYVLDFAGTKVED